MINAEKHKNELRTLFKLNKLQDCALRKGNGSFGNCYNIGCKNCMFNDKEGCTYERIKWMLSECKEPLKVSKLEYDILKYLSDNTRHMYIVRNKSGDIYLYDLEPEKSRSGNWWEGRGVHVMVMFNKLFQFVQWEDTEPRSIKEILKNCVVENIKEEQ
jgi:hypothetical protein